MLIVAAAHFEIEYLKKREGSCWNPKFSDRSILRLECTSGLCRIKENETHNRCTNHFDDKIVAVVLVC